MKKIFVLLLLVFLIGCNETDVVPSITYNESPYDSDISDDELFIYSDTPYPDDDIIIFDLDLDIPDNYVFSNSTNTEILRTIHNDEGDIIGFEIPKGVIESIDTNWHSYKLKIKLKELLDK